MVICGRSQERLDAAVEKLSKNNSAVVSACTADVTSYESVLNLVSYSISFFKEHTGRAVIDIWINNAGISQAPLLPLADTDADTIQSIVNTNLVGSLFCTKVAINQMKQQEEGGHVFLMDGAGSNGMVNVEYHTLVVGY